MTSIFCAKDYLVGRDAPIDVECGVVPGNGSFGLGGIEVVAFVLEDNLVAQHTESVGKSTGHEELTVIILGKFATNPLSVGG